jgi:hypothetical protein
VIRPQAAGASTNHKAPLAPKQGLGGSLANARGQHSSPISGTYALRTPRGKITSIACESCRKRKSKVRKTLQAGIHQKLTNRLVRWRSTQMQHLPIQEPHLCIRRRRGWQDDHATTSACPAISERAGRHEVCRIVISHGSRPGAGSHLGE